MREEELAKLGEYEASLLLFAEDVLQSEVRCDFFGRQAGSTCYIAVQEVV